MYNELGTLGEVSNKTSVSVMSKDPKGMIDDDHYSTNANYGSLHTHKNPIKKQKRPFADATCSTHVPIVCKISLRRREPRVAPSSVPQIVDHMNNISRNPSVMFCD